MDERRDSQPSRLGNRTTVERTSDREVVVRRTFNAPASAVFEAWARPDLFKLWWPPKSMGMPLLSCEMDVRVGGGYRLEFGQDAANAFAFFGRYTEAVPLSRLVWTNDESADGATTTVTFEEKDGGTLVVLSELYPTKAGLDEAIVGTEGCMPEQFDQLDELLVSLAAGKRGA